MEKVGIEEYKIVEYEPTWIEKIIGFLVHPMISGLLIMAIIGGIYFEMQSPGIGFPLGVAILAAVAYFAPLYLEGLAANWEILVFIIGVILGDGRNICHSRIWSCRSFRCCFNVC